ncbi:MAG: four helix bundle protein [Ruminococcaceae bacterium]|nr:four helix bundle protein [Oscillospiraceae bacterium]
MENNVIVDKTKHFALQIIKTYNYLSQNKKEFIMSKQLMRSGTSIGANVREAQRAQSIPDFYSKMNIALKEAEESLYWIELLQESGTIKNESMESLYSECEEIVRLLVSITKQQNK